MKYIIYFALFLLMSAIAMNAQTTLEVNYSKIFELKQLSHEKKMQNSIQKNIKTSEPVIFSVKSDYANSVFLADYQSIRIKDFRISANISKNLILKPAVTSISAYTEWVKVVKGRFIKVQGPYIVSYHGKIEGEEGSSVFLNYYNGKLFGFIENEAKEKFSISPDINQITDINSDHFIQNTAIESDNPNFNPFVCLTEDNTGVASESEHGKPDGKPLILKLKGTILLSWQCAFQFFIYFRPLPKKMTE